jgi:hypothetical protein
MQIQSGRTVPLSIQKYKIQIQSRKNYHARVPLSICQPSLRRVSPIHISALLRHSALLKATSQLLIPRPARPLPNYRNERKKRRFNPGEIR